MTAVAVQGVAIRRSDQLVVRDVSFTVGSGELVALLGASGSGKTTILRAMAALEPLAAGQIVLGDLCLRAGIEPGTAVRRQMHRAVGIVFQFHNLFSHLSAAENVCLAPVHVLGQSNVEATRTATALLESLGVGHRAAALPHELSGGEAQRVAIARALAVRPRVLLMDEPTASLDDARRLELARCLRDLVSGGQAVVVATHDHAFVDAAADRRVTLRDGSMVHDPTEPGLRSGVS